MKKWPVIILIILLVTHITSAFAESDKGDSFLDSVGSFFAGTWEHVGELSSSAWEDTSEFVGNAWGEASEWVGNAWEDASKWIGDAWGDAAKWVNQSWNDSSIWIADIWGDASTWASETYSAVSDNIATWWAETFSTVTKTNQHSWAWLQETASSQNQSSYDMLQRIKSAINTADGTSDARVQETFFDFLYSLGISDTDADKVWETILAYAEQKGLDGVKTAQLTLPYIYKLIVDSASNPGESIPAIAVAQYVTAVVEKLGISDNTELTGLIDQLNDILIAM